MKQFDYRVAFYSMLLVIAVLIIAAFGNNREAPDSHRPAFFGTATLDFPNTAAGTSNDLTITVTGAETGDYVVLSYAPGVVVGNGTYTAYVSAANTVTVTHFNYALLAASNPASGVFNAIVFRK